MASQNCIKELLTIYEKKIQDEVYANSRVSGLNISKGKLFNKANTIMRKYLVNQGGYPDTELFRSIISTIGFKCRFWANTDANNYAIKREMDKNATILYEYIQNHTHNPLLQGLFSNFDCFVDYLFNAFVFLENNFIYRDKNFIKITVPNYNFPVIVKMIYGINNITQYNLDVKYSSPTKFEKIYMKYVSGEKILSFNDVAKKQYEICIFLLLHNYIREKEGEIDGRN